MASRLSSLPAITIGSDKSGVVQGSETQQHKRALEVKRWGSVQQLPCQQKKWTGELGGL